MILKNSVILITGGSSGLGKSTAKLLLGLGAKVAITGLDEEKLNRVANELGALPIKADVAKDADIERTFKTVIYSSQIGLR